jgi:hypothetical protein
MPSTLLSPSGHRATFTSILRVGRHPENDLVLDDAAVSGWQAVLEWKHEAWQVRDVGSRNGTTLNGRTLIGPRPLKAGDALRFAGGEAWTVAALDPPPPSEGLRSTQVRPAGPPVPDDFALELLRAGLTGGTIVAVHGGERRAVEAAQPFLLLDLLARKPQTWVPSAELVRAIWGRQEVSRGILSTLVHATRRLLKANGVAFDLIRSENGKYALDIPAERVRRGEAVTGT